MSTRLAGNSRKTIASQHGQVGAYDVHVLISCTFSVLGLISMDNACAALPSLLSDEAAMRGADSSIKRNTALLKKMRMLAEDSVAGLVAECQTVNQAKVGSPVISQALLALHCSPSLTQNAPMNWKISKL